ncbi:hypothetical protein SASPL_130729 [Salvia splendens]|uniref:DUF4005 domain-containing protein n=1 Tax=Salvia splendens TaxID=180675 RepID=A0A8X8ZJP8_SALSN|nr:hypothetical protein SASPL_130729 [Salvia splendens]
MVKKTSSSWLTAVKRAFRSPTKDSDSDKKQSNSNAAQAPVMAPEQRHAIAVEMIRPCPKAAASYKHETAAARVIQTAFRGYLARRALVALKGIVKLQALIRGQNARKQANMTMKCMQSLLRVRARLSHDAGRRSMFAETTNLWESKYLRDRNSRVYISP